jgi:hypothetical protein
MIQALYRALAQLGVVRTNRIPRAAAALMALLKSEAPSTQLAARAFIKARAIADLPLPGVNRSL